MTEATPQWAWLEIIRKLRDVPTNRFLLWVMTWGSDPWMEEILDREWPTGSIKITGLPKERDDSR